VTEQSTVLIVDDEADVREVLAFWLRREGFRVLVAEESAEGIAVAQSEGPDIILLDVMMPGISGWEVLERLKDDDRTRRIPVVMCTILVEPRFLARATELGAAGYIGKPFKPEAVVKTIRGTLEAAGDPG